MSAALATAAGEPAAGTDRPIRTTRLEAHAWSGLDACVHCGFCLPACPTYAVTADEADSPRGRIVLMRAVERGAFAADDPGLAYHLDRCLGCRGCESVCPSGVTYGPALEATRARQARARGLPGSVRAALWLLALPGRQRAPWAAARALRATRLPEWCARGAGVGAPRLATLLGMLAATRPSRALPPSPAPSGAVAPAGSAAPGAARGTDAVPREDAAPGEAALLLGCVMRGLFGHVHGATVRALAANGVRVREVPDQVCCGALAAHAGDAAGAQALARRNVAAFERAPGAAIVVNSAGCGAMMKDYGHWLADDPEWAERGRAMAARVRDVSEVLAARGPKPGTRAVPLRVAYDAPCHLLHAQRVAAPPLRVLDAVPGLTLVPLEGAERCCGSAGLFALTEPAMAGDVLAAKLDAIEAAAPDVVVTGNPGCVMHIGAGLLARGHAIPVRHPVELLAWSYAR